jgi:hypothetical protein
MLTDIPPPWDVVLGLIVGPVGAFVALGVAIFFLWRLFREEQAKNIAKDELLRALTDAVRNLTTEVKAWREASK